MSSPMICFIVIFSLVWPEVTPFGICEDSQVSAVASKYDTRMIFLVIDDFYWYLKSDVVPTDKNATALPDFFNKVTAAFYIDTNKPCGFKKVRVRAGIKQTEMDVWLFGPVNKGDIPMIPYDTRTSRLDKSRLTSLHKDHCFQKAKINWSRPIDAAFATDNFIIYLIQGNNYSSVNCSFICKDPDKHFGTANGPWPASDLGITKDINAVFPISKNRLVTFDAKEYKKFEFTVGKDTRLMVKKFQERNQILPDYFKITKFATNCGVKEVETKTEPTGETMQTDEAGLGGQTDSAPDSALPPEEGSDIWLWLIIAVIVIIVIGIGIALFFLSKNRSSQARPPPAQPQPVAKRPAEAAPKRLAKK